MGGNYFVKHLEKGTKGWHVDTTPMSKEDMFRMVQMMGGMKNKSIQPMLEMKED